MKWRYTCLSVIVLVLFGCVTSQPMVSMEKGVSLKGYSSFYVPDVANQTGNEYEFDVAGTLTQEIKEELGNRGLDVTEDKSTENLLVVTCSLVSYEPGSAFKRWLVPGYGKTQATVKTLLIDNTSNEVLGEFISAEAVSAGGLYSAGADKRILAAIAQGIADQIESLLKTD